MSFGGGECKQRALSTEASLRGGVLIIVLKGDVDIRSFDDETCSGWLRSGLRVLENILKSAAYISYTS